jgi:predicted transglutaminase-like cysteine proteinase
MLQPAAFRRFGVLACTLIPLAGCGSSPPAGFAAAARDLSAAINADAPNLGSFRRWNEVIARFDHQRRDPAAACSPATAACPREQWARLVAALRGLPPRERVLHVNAVLNRVPYVPTQRNWGVAGYWETPYEFLARGGQCQDYAIAKYLALEESGVSTDALRFVVAYDRLSGLDHAVDVVTVDGAQLVLDNQVQDVTPAMGNQRYRPYYALNDRGWWAYDVSDSDALPPAAQFADSGFRLARY